MQFDFKAAIGTVATVGAGFAFLLNTAHQKAAADAVLNCTQVIGLETPALCKEAAVQTAIAAKSLYQSALVGVMGLGSLFNLFGTTKKK